MKYMIGLVMVLLISPTVMAAEAGITPDSFLWGLDRFFEKIQLFFTFDEDKKAELRAEIIEERLAESEAVKDNPEAKEKVELVLEEIRDSQIEYVEKEDTTSNSEKGLETTEDSSQEKVGEPQVELVDDETLQETSVKTTDENSEPTKKLDSEQIKVEYEKNLQLREERLNLRDRFYKERDRRELAALNSTVEPAYVGGLSPSCGDGVCASYETKCGCGQDCGFCPEGTSCGFFSCLEIVPNTCFNMICEDQERETCPWDCPKPVVREEQEEIISDIDRLILDARYMSKEEIEKGLLEIYKKHPDMLPSQGENLW